MTFKTKLAGAAAIGVALLGVSYTSLHAQAAARTVADGVYDAEQATRGKAAYEAKCAMCHGVGLEGADAAPPLAGGRFLDNWKGQSVHALVTRTRTTMPLNEPGSMGMAETSEIIAYILQANQFPAGQALATDAQTQQQIQIVGK